MIRSILLALAVMGLSAPARAVVIYEESGLAQFLLTTMLPLDTLGNYRVTLAAPGAETFNLFYLNSEIWKEYYYEEGQLVGANPDLVVRDYVSPDRKVTRSKDLVVLDYPRPPVRDFRDAELTGTFAEVIDVYLWIDIINIPIDPVPYRLTIELLSVPEPATWAMMVGGFGIVGGAVRRQRRSTARLT